MTAEEIRGWLVTRIATTLRVDSSAIDDRAAFDSYGLSSSDAVTLSGDLEELLGRELSPTLVYEYPSIAALSRFLAGTHRTAPASPASAAEDLDASRQIAIVGIGCRFPGAADPSGYWRLLRDGIDAIREVPADRWDARAFFHPDASVPGKAVTRWGGFLDAVDGFEPFFFGISPGEAERMDPQQRLLLELAYESFEDAGYPMTRLAGTRAGVFVGISINEYGFLQFGDHERLNGHSGTGNALSIAANRISYFFDLHGPSMAVDTACSSSLTAVHLACRSLRSGECDLALAGGVNVVLSPAHSIAFTKAGVLAPDGRCKVFDARADGYVRGEGGGLVVLKPLSKALADGDTVLAVIRGSAIHQDGRTNGLMAPSREAQEAVLRDAYRDAGVPPARVQYVEAHGTGTLLGDSIEARALGAVLGPDRTNGPCLVGSVKSNLGHLEAAAGIAGLVKVVLALQERTIPPSLHFATPNPHIPFGELGLRVAADVTPWPAHQGAALAGVSSFGFGGTNVHVVLEEAPSSVPGRHADLPAAGTADVLLVSAHSAQALRALAHAHRDLLSGPESGDRPSFPDVCAASRRRNHLEHRLALVAGSTEELIESLDGFLSGASQPGVACGDGSPIGKGKLAFVFSGQGSQWLGMGRELMQQEPAFRATLDQCERVLGPHVDWSLLEQLEAQEGRSRLGEIDVLQPTLFALQVGLASLWRAWGLEPDAVVGHSMGEVAAAHVAGALTLEDAARVICARSRLLRRLSGRGGMAVVGLTLEETARALDGYEGRLSIAASNSPQSTVVSGDVAALADFTAALERNAVFCSLINVDVASHSPQTEPLGVELRSSLESLQPRPASLPLISTVTGAPCDGPFDAGYWVRNLTEPVNFTAAIRELVRTGHTTFIEISPHPVMQGAVQQVLTHLDALGMVLASTGRDEPERHGMLRSLAALYASGRTPLWSKRQRSPGRPVALPNYPWQRERFWMDPAEPRPNGRGTHPLLGRRLVLAREPQSSLWQLDLDAERVAFLRDHRVNGQVVVPASVFVELALSAAASTGISGSHSLVDLELCRSLVLAPGERRTLQVALSPAGDQGRLSFSVHSKPAGVGAEDWTLHATAVLTSAGGDQATQPSRDLAAIRREMSEQVSPDSLYRALAARGLEYGPTLRGVEQVWRGNGEVLGRITLSALLHHETDGYQVHPAILDAGLQVLAATAAKVTEAGDADTYVPVRCERVKLYQRPGNALWSHVVMRSGMIAGAAEIAADVHLLDDAGRAVMDLIGLRLMRVAVTPSSRPSTPEERHTWLYGVRWQANAWPAADALPEPWEQGPNRWLVLADRDGIAEAVQRHLETRGQRCTLLSADAVAGNPEGDDSAIRDAIRAQLDAEHEPLRGVIQLWSGEPALSCNAALHLVQGLVKCGGRLGTPRVWLVTRGAQPVLPEDPLSPIQAPLWGLGRTIGFELPEFKCTLIDLDPSVDPTAAADLLFRELRVGDAEDQVGLRAGRRFVPRLVPVAQPPLCPAPGSAPLRPDGTYLITGGLGGLGLAVARWMIAQNAGHLVLVGRTAPGAAAAAAVEKMRRVGGDISVMSADVAVGEELARVLEHIRTSLPPLRGIVHAAGVVDNAAIVNLDADRMARVLAPKVRGAWNLHVATAREQLDFFVLFSSAVSVLGSPGQGNYAAANSYLDVLSHFRHRAGLPAISINWGPWVDIGLVASGDFFPASTRSGTQGVKGITPERGLEALQRALGDARAQVTVLPFDIASLLDLYPAAARLPFFAEVGGKDTHVSRVYARPSLRQDYVAPRNDIERKLAELWRQTLRIDRVGVRDSFFELGGDSVLAAQIVTSAHRTFGVAIDLREAFEAFTIEHLAKRVAAALVARIDALSESEAQRLLQE